MTNFEWLLENEKDLVKCLMLGSQPAKKNGKLVLCDEICCGDCDWELDCKRVADNEFIKEWLDEEYKDRYRLSRFEYDLLDSWSGNTKLCDGSFIMRLIKKGYLKNIDPTLYIDEILTNCEVVEND